MENCKLYLFLIKSWDDHVYGIVENVSEEWVLVKRIINDYLFDGYTLIRKKYIKDVIRNSDVTFKEDVLIAKGYMDIKKSPNISINNVLDPLVWLKESQTIFMLSPKDESICFLGKIEKILSDYFNIKALDSKGQWAKKLYRYRFNNIRTIDFETDYINSLLAYNLRNAK